MSPQIVDTASETDRLKKELAARQVHQEQRVLELQLQPQRIAQQALQQRIWRFGKIFLQTLRLQPETRQSCLRIMRECGKKLFNLGVSLLFAPRKVEKRESATKQRSDQNAAFPEQHLIVTIELNRVLEV